MTQTATDVWDDPDHVFAFHKGRVALHAILEAAKIGPGDEVLVPAFTCFVVAAAIIYRGARPVYFDIRPDTYHGDLNHAVSKLTQTTRAVIVQHTLGWADKPDENWDVFRDRGILIIEDCAHTIGTATLHGPVGTLGDASFTSLQWSKPATLGLGGLARANDPMLAESLRQVHTSYPPASRTSEGTLRILRRTHGALVRPSTFWAIQSLYRAAAATRIIPGSSSPEEFDRFEAAPRGYRATMGRSRTQSISKTLRTATLLGETRRETYSQLRGMLPTRFTLPPLDDSQCRTIPLRAPMQLTNRAAFLDRARRHRIEVGDWFCSVLHPLEANLERLHYHAGECPTAERTAASMVNLPIHSKVDERTLRAIVRHLEQHQVESIES